jgi:NAD(P)-dependent dehydrogenase (short-subunit alcohol dehydrogenase family)
VQLKDKNNFVIATARNTASNGLKELKSKHDDSQLALIDLDLSKQETIHAAAEKAAKLLPNGLDYLISNAGVGLTGLSSFDDMYVLS